MFLKKIQWFCVEQWPNYLTLWLAGPVLRTFAQYLIAFCSRTETANDVIWRSFSWSSVKPFSRNSTKSRQRWHFQWFIFLDNFGSEVVSDVISEKLRQICHKCVEIDNFPGNCWFSTKFRHYTMDIFRIKCTQFGCDLIWFGILIFNCIRVKFFPRNSVDGGAICVLQSASFFPMRIQG